MTAEMNPASLPVIYLNVNDEYINPLHGYTVPMEGNYLRGSITPLSANRELNFRADLYDAHISKVAYEIRTKDMSRLIEDTELPGFTYNEGEARLYATLPIKDLISDNTEYMLIIKLYTGSGSIIRYYARIINRMELYLSEKMNFVNDFSDRTFNKEAAAELKTYMESNSLGDNTSFGYVNIHSSFKQLTWGDLNPVLVSNKDMEILEIDETTASIRLTYQVQTLNERHNVTEFFRILRGTKRMFLMEYERTMDQIFDESKNVLIGDKLFHGILHDQVNVVENESGTVYCFEQENGLFCYNSESGTIARIFSFWDPENDDARTRFDAHKVKALKVDDAGNIRFIVYGYMNRGTHEGQTGITMYYYDSTVNTVEEVFFIPYTKSYQMLEKDLSNLSYVNNRDVFYVLVDGTVYMIAINSMDVQVVEDMITDARFVSSKDHSIIAWQSGLTIPEYTSINLLQLNEDTPVTITADPGKIIIPLGFMDHDLIYGIAEIEDLTTDATGRTIIPMYALHIQDTKGNLLKEYQMNNVYITDTYVEDNMIVLSRLYRNPETMQFEETDEDQIMNNASLVNYRNKYTSIVTELEETTYRTILYKEYTGKDTKILTPKEVLYEGDRSIPLDNEDPLTRYYVYAKGELTDIVTEVADAVISAEKQYGVVVDKNDKYIWESENRKPSVRINSVEVIERLGANAAMEGEGQDAMVPTDETQEESPAEYNMWAMPAEYGTVAESVALCTDAMLRTQSIFMDMHEVFPQKTVSEALSQIEGATVLDLSGCSLDAVLYYVSLGYPVLSFTEGNNAVLIAGYDSKNTIVYFPMEEDIRKVGMQDSTQWFETCGNRYITFIK